MGDVAADRTGVHGARSIDVPPGSPGREKHDSRESSGKRCQAQPSNCAGACHFTRALYLQNAAQACHDFVRGLNCKNLSHKRRSKPEAGRN
jgi:hypothetical protein